MVHRVKGIACVKESKESNLTTAIALYKSEKVEAGEYFVSTVAL